MMRKAGVLEGPANQDFMHNTIKLIHLVIGHPRKRKEDVWAQKENVYTKLKDWNAKIKWLDVTSQFSDHFLDHFLSFPRLNFNVNFQHLTMLGVVSGQEVKL